MNKTQKTCILICLIYRYAYNYNFICNRRSKLKSGPSIKPEYRLELEKVNAAAVAKVVEEEFGPKLQRAGGKIVFGDNDKKLHSDV